MKRSRRENWFEVKGSGHYATRVLSGGKELPDDYNTALWQRLFGFSELEGSSEAYVETQKQFELHPDETDEAGEALLLKSLGNGETYKIGHFTCPTLGELRAAAGSEETPKDGSAAGITLQHVFGDVSVHIGTSPNCVVQAASQFNCLEASHSGLFS